MAFDRVVKVIQRIAPILLALWVGTALPVQGAGTGDEDEFSYANHDNPRLIGGHTGVMCKTCHPTSLDSAYYRDGIQYGRDVVTEKRQLRQLP